MTDRGAGEEKMTHEVTMDSIIDPTAGEESPMCNALSKDGHKCIWPTFKHPEYHESASHLARVGGEGPLEPAITTWPFIREEQGTFACPICGVATPHEHTGEEIAKFRSRRKEKTEPIPEERAGREAIRMQDFESQMKHDAGLIDALNGDKNRLRKERDEWRRKYFEMERAQSLSIDQNGEHIKRIQRLERDKDEIRNDHKAQLAAQPSVQRIPLIDLSEVTYFVYKKDGSMQPSDDPYRRDYVIYQDFIVVVEQLRELAGGIESAKQLLRANLFSNMTPKNRQEIEEEVLAALTFPQRIESITAERGSK